MLSQRGMRKRGCGGSLIHRKWQSRDPALKGISRESPGVRTHSQGCWCWLLYACPAQHNTISRKGIWVITWKLLPMVFISNFGMTEHPLIIFFHRLN